MSFSGDVKKEIARIVPEQTCCALAEFTALFSFLGSFCTQPGKEEIRITTEQVAVAKKCLRLMRSLFAIELDLDINKSSGHANQYVILLTRQEAIGEILERTQIHRPEVFRERILKKNCCVRAFLRGAYLAIGSVSDPGKSYHLEFACRRNVAAEYIRSLMRVFEIESGLTQRKNKKIVYIKDSSLIIDLLNVIGAHQSLMQMENVRILKEMRNSANRQFNCDSANINKMVKAAKKQVEDIRLIRNHPKWNELPPALLETAELRLEYPDVSIQELGTYLDPPVGKSGVNHRLRRLSQIAEEIREENGKAASAEI